MNSRCEHLRQVAETTYLENALYRWNKKEPSYAMMKRIVSNAFDAGFTAAIEIAGVETRLCTPTEEKA